MPKLRRLGLALLVASILAGCATTADQPAAGKKSSDDEAEYIPTGSHISNRVKKKQLESSDAKKTHDQQLMQEMQKQQPDPQDPLTH